MSVHRVNLALSVCISSFEPPVSTYSGILAVEQAKPLVMLCGQHSVFHPGLFCRTRPRIGVKARRIPLFKILFIFLPRYLFVAHHPSAAARNGVQAPMNKHAEAVVHKPFCALSSFFKNIHMLIYPFTAPAVRLFIKASEAMQNIIMVGTTDTMIAENIPL